MSRTKYVCGGIDPGVASTVRAALVTDYFKEIGKAIREESPHVSLPWVWGPDGNGYHGPGVSDPVTLYIELPIAASDDDEIVFGISLEEVVDDYIEGMTNGLAAVDKICEADAVERTKVLAQRLHELANKIEAHCANEAEQAEWQRKWGDRAR
jgi:hypothetical protein